MGRTGGLFTSLTVTLKVLVSLKGGTLLSVTTVVMGYMPGPWASFGVQVMTPLASMLAPAGGLIRA